MKNVIILEKIGKKEQLPVGIANIIALAKMLEVFNLVDLAKRYNGVISNVDQNKVNGLGLTGIKKYCNYAGQGKMQLD